MPRKQRPDREGLQPYPLAKLFGGQRVLSRGLRIAEKARTEDAFAEGPELQQLLEFTEAYQRMHAETRGYLESYGVRIEDTPPLQAYTSFHPAANLEVNLTEALANGVSVPASLLFVENATHTALRLYAIVRAAGVEDRERGEARLYANQAWMCQRMTLVGSAITKAATALRKAGYLETRRGTHGKDTYEYAVRLDGGLFLPR